MTLDDFVAGHEDGCDESEDDCTEFLYAKGNPTSVVELLQSCKRKDKVSEVCIVLETADAVSFEVLLAYANLVTISINKCSPAMIEEIVKHSPTVKNIAIINCPEMRDCNAIRVAAGRIEDFQVIRCANLESLDGIEALVELKHFSSLLENRRLSDISQLKQLKHVHYVALVGGSCPVEVAFLQEMQSITRLTFTDCKWLSDIKFMLGMGRLTKIYLEGSWNVPMYQLALLHLSHPNCSIVFPWEKSKLRVLFSISLHLTAFWFKTFPRKTI